MTSAATASNNVPIEIEIRFQSDKPPKIVSYPADSYIHYLIYPTANNLEQKSCTRLHHWYLPNELSSKTYSLANLFYKAEADKKIMVIYVSEKYGRHQTNQSSTVATPSEACISHCNEWINLRIFCFLLKLHYQQLIIKGKKPTKDDIESIDSELHEIWNQYQYTFHPVGDQVSITLDAMRKLIDAINSNSLFSISTYPVFLSVAHTLPLVEISRCYFAAFNMSCYSWKYFWLLRSCLSSFYCVAPGFKSVDSLTTLPLKSISVELHHPVIKNKFPSAPILQSKPIAIKSLVFYDAQSFFHDVMDYKTPSSARDVSYMKSFFISATAGGRSVTKTNSLSEEVAIESDGNNNNNNKRLSSDSTTAAAVLGTISRTNRKASSTTTSTGTVKHKQSPVSSTTAENTVATAGVSDNDDDDDDDDDPENTSDASDEINLIRCSNIECKKGTLDETDGLYWFTLEEAKLTASPKVDWYCHPGCRNNSKKSIKKKSAVDRSSGPTSKTVKRKLSPASSTTDAGAGSNPDVDEAVSTDESEAGSESTEREEEQARFQPPSSSSRGRGRPRKDKTQSTSTLVTSDRK